MDNYNGFPATYQPVYQPNMYYQPTQTQVYGQRNWQPYQQSTVQPNYQQQPQANQPMNNSMVWVQGEAGAKAYVLPNNTTLPLWDSEAQVIYIKSVDATGKPSMTILDYVDRNANTTETDNKTPVEYATKEQLDSVSGRFAEITGQISELTNQIDDIENRIMSFGKPQQNTNSNNRRGNK